MATIHGVYAKELEEIFKKKENQFSKLFQQDAHDAFHYMATAFSLKDPLMSKGTPVKMLSPDRSYIQEFSSLDAPAMESVGWTAVSALACDACGGTGKIGREICWHCEGGKFDPTKYDYEFADE